MNNDKCDKKRKRTDITIQRKNELSAIIKQDPMKNQRALALKYNLSLGMINKLIKMKTTIILPQHAQYKIRDAKCKKTQDLEPILFAWFQNCRRRNIRINAETLQTKALEIASKLHINEFKASTGWLASFIKRNGISSKNIYGEANLVDQNVLECFKGDLERKMAEYDDKNIFNTDETGLMYKAAGKKTYIFSEENCANGKYSKERVTLLFAVSKTGEKLKPLFIGKSQRPRCFKNIDLKHMPLFYEYNCKSWMTINIFTKWLNDVNALMTRENRKILLLLDNAPVHPKDLEFTNIELFYFPPNTTSKIQPLDQGIIKVFKDGYRKILNADIISRMEIDSEITFEKQLQKINVLDAINWSKRAWDSITAECIINCFNKGINNCGITPEAVNNDEYHVQVQLSEENEIPAFDPRLNEENDLLDHFIHMHFSEKDESSEESVEDKIDPVLTRLEAFVAVEKLEKYFLINDAQYVNIVWKLKDILNDEGKKCKVKITDYMLHTKK